MPELPEVRNVAKMLNEKIVGKKILDIMISRSKMIKEINIIEFKVKLVGKTILKVDNMGKYILFYLSDDLVLISHLRMEGKYHIEKWEDSKHDYVVFKFEDKTELFYNDSRQFGTFHLRTTENHLRLYPLSRLALEPQDTDPQKFFVEVLSTTKTAIKNILLDQEFILGIGNIYADEILFEMKLHPQTPAHNLMLEDVQELLKVSTRILELATSKGGTTIRSYESLDKKKGEFQDFLKVHGREGEKCVNCGTKITKIKVGGRGTYICPKEQVMPKGIE